MKAKKLNSLRVKSLVVQLLDRLLELSRVEGEDSELEPTQELQAWLLGEVLHLEVSNREKPLDVMFEIVKGHAYGLWKQDRIVEPCNGKLQIKSLIRKTHHVQMSLSGGQGQFGALHEFEGEALSAEALVAEVLFDIRQQGWTKQYLRDYWIVGESK